MAREAELRWGRVVGVLGVDVGDDGAWEAVFLADPGGEVAVAAGSGTEREVRSSTGHGVASVAAGRAGNLEPGVAHRFPRHLFSGLDFVVPESPFFAGVLLDFEDVPESPPFEDFWSPSLLGEAASDSACACFL